MATPTIPVEELFGEWKGNGCCCTPACYRARAGKHPCCANGVCWYPGICGCGPSCPEPCGQGLTPCFMCGANVYTDCNTYLRFKKEGETISVEPLCCGCGAGYVKASGGAPPSTTEMER